jgi:predicted nucleotidyltransferase component of viral defense system
MTSGFEQSFKKRLGTVAKERNMTPTQVWQNVIHERFIVRLCQSPYRDNFVLKGGSLLARHTDIGRETRDLDFSVRNLQSNIDRLHKVIDDVASLDVQDGFSFQEIKMSPLDHPRMEYQGARIRIKACLGKARLPLLIDLGFGDCAQAKEEKIALLASAKGALFEKEIHLHCYPVEFIFAEKLETIVFKKEENSRMKDYHDLHTIITNGLIVDKLNAMQAVRAVFHHRGTPLSFPIHFDALLLSILQNYWKEYTQHVTSDRLPPSIDQVIAVINRWLE